MDYWGLTVGWGYVLGENCDTMKQFVDLSDEEKKEYLERNRSHLSEQEIKLLNAYIPDEQQLDESIQNHQERQQHTGRDIPTSIFRGPGIG